MSDDLHDWCGTSRVSSTGILAETRESMAGLAAVVFAMARYVPDHDLDALIGELRQQDEAFRKASREAKTSAERRDLWRAAAVVHYGLIEPIVSERASRASRSRRMK